VSIRQSVVLAAVSASVDDSHPFTSPPDCLDLVVLAPWIWANCSLKVFPFSLYIYSVHCIYFDHDLCCCNGLTNISFFATTLTLRQICFRLVKISHRLTPRRPLSIDNTISTLISLPSMSGNREEAAVRVSRLCDWLFRSLSF
jgi:hypothetical protein